MNGTEWQAELTMQVTQDRNHIQGPAAAPVTLFQHGDYECPRRQVASRVYAKNLGPPRLVGHGSGSLFMMGYAYESE
jgi:hypothetical protein